jgi:hypothetical protein
MRARRKGRNSRKDGKRQRGKEGGRKRGAEE